MDLEELLTPEGVTAHLKVTSKKQALQELSAKAAAVCGLPERAIFETLLERERLGSRSEERRVGKSVDGGGRRTIRKKTTTEQCAQQH